MIPKKVHQIWIGPTIPENYSRWMATVRHHFSAWDYCLYRAGDLRRFEGALKKQGLSPLHPSFQSDFIRLCLLWVHGGLYLDADVEAFSDINVTRQIDGVVEGTRPGPDPCIVFVPPKTKWVGEVLRRGCRMPTTASVLSRFSYPAISVVLGMPEDAVHITELPLVHHGTWSWKDRKTTEGVMSGVPAEILVGAVGCGQSTYLDRLPGYTRISFNAILASITADTPTERYKEALLVAQGILNQCLATNTPVVFTDANHDPKAREGLVRKLEAMGFLVKVTPFRGTVEQVRKAGGGSSQEIILSMVMAEFFGVPRTPEVLYSSVERVVSSTTMVNKPKCGGCGSSRVV